MLKSEIKNKILDVFKKQQSQALVVGASSYKERIKKLNRLLYAVEKTYRPQIKEALYKDFKKPYTESDLTEIYVVTSEIKFAKKNLYKWMDKQRVPTPMSLFGGSSWTKYQAKGCCLIISPWNFPFNLTFCPLVSAIASGNVVIIKPSEMTPHTSRVMQNIIEAIFDEDEVAMFEGDVEVSQELLKLPFNHMFFTGAPAIGKIVMKAAAEHLASVTLELGGKSPTIIDQTANIKQAAKRIAWAKFINNGQSCIAPDYILVHESKKEALIDALKENLEKLFGEDVLQSESYCRIVNERHFNRVNQYLKNSIKKGAQVVYGGQTLAKENFISPTLVLDMKDDSDLLQEEIFGPVLPIKTYTKLEEVINYINTKEKPLALYIFSKSHKNTQHVIKYTRAGGTCINNCLLHFSNHNLPFGGDNNSGIGKTHGFYGFKEFSNERAFYKQNFSSFIEFLFPPYNLMKQKLSDFTIKWF